MGLSLTPATSLASLRQARTLVNGMSPRQRMIAIGGALAVLVAIAAFVVSMAQPTYAVLYSGLAAHDAQQVADQLSVIGIPYQVAPDGASVSVPQQDLDRARLALASLGLPHSGQQGFSLFDKTNWSGSDFDEQVNYQRAIEGELERTIESMQGVRSANVTVTMAHDSLFASQDRPAKAAVVLSLVDGQMAPGMVTSIRHLVASAVDHLSPQNVAVINSDGQIALSGGVAAQSTLEQQLAAKIVDTLAPIVGRRHVRAAVTVAYDPTSSDDTQETYDPKGSVVLSQQMSSTGGAAAPSAAGVPGTTSNLPNVKPAGVNFKAQLGLSGARGQQSSSATYAVSRTVDHTIRPADTVQRLTAAVLVDDASQKVLRQGHWVTVEQARSPAEMQQLQNLAAAAVGLNPARGDVLTISNLPFLARPAAPASGAAPGAAPPRAGWRQMLPAWLPGWAPEAGIGLLALLLFGLLGLGLIRRSKPRPAAAAQSPQQIGVGQSLETGAAPPEVRETSQMLNITEMLEADPEDTPPEVKQVLMLKMKLAEKVRREPAIAGRLVQVWMNKRREEAL